MSCSSLNTAPNRAKRRAAESNKSDTEKAELLALRVKDFCQRIGISPSTFWVLVKSEKIRVIRISGRTLVPFAEVERILVEGVR